MRGRWRARWSPATTPSGGPRRSASGSTSPPSCAAWRRRPAILSSSSRAPLGRCVDLLELGDDRGRRHPDRRRVRVRRVAAPLPFTSGGPPGLRCARAQLTGDFDAGGGARRRGAGARPARPGRERHPLLRAGAVQHPPRAGPARRDRGRRAALRRSIPRSRLARLAGAAARRARAAGRGPRGYRGARGVGLRPLPRDANWLIAVTLLAEVCGALGDAARAGELYRMLEPGSSCSDTSMAKGCASSAATPAPCSSTIPTGLSRATACCTCTTRSGADPRRDAAWVPAWRVGRRSAIW